MSPKNKKKLNILRKSLDKLDTNLLRIIKARSKLVNKVLILKNIKKKSLKNNIDPKITNKIWKNMISSYIDYEKRNFRKK